MILCQKKRNKAQILVLNIILLTLLLPGLNGHKEEGLTLATDPNTLIFGMDTLSIYSLDPALAYELTSCMADFAIYDQLVTPNPTDYTIMEPALAESWSKSADRKTWIFNLRQDVTFHSGNKMTADDVVWSFQRVVTLNFAPDWVILQFGLTMDGIKKIDDYIVSLTFDDAYADFLILSCLAFSVGSVLDKELVLNHEQKTTEYPDGDWGNTWLMDHGAGSGAFILDHWAKFEEIVFVRNDSWWKTTPGIKKVIFKDIPEPTLQMMMLEEGDIDIAVDLQTDQINQLRNREGIQIQSTSKFSVTYLGMNMGKFKPFKDERVRDAVRWAIDYEGIINDILGGGAVKGQTFIPHGMLGHNPATPYIRDVDKAIDLLTDAGYSKGFEVELLCSTIPPYREIALKIQDDLDDVGILATVIQMVSGEMYQIYRQQDHQMLLAGWGADYPDPNALAQPFAHCETIGVGAKIRQLAWRNMAENPELAALVDAAVLEPDQSKRVGMYMDLQETVLDWGPFAILYYPLKEHGVRTWVKDYELSPMFYGGIIWTIHKAGITTPPPLTTTTPPPLTTTTPPPLTITITTSTNEQEPPETTSPYFIPSFQIWEVFGAIIVIMIIKNRQIRRLM